MHQDHTEGLDAAEFYDRLSSRNDIFLYCSEVTKILLMEKYAKLEKFVKTLKVGEACLIPIPEQNSTKTETVTVTLIHASHCPGSVMFLFEGSEGNALYTGDFRWESDQIMRVPALHVDQRVKPLVSLYVDTTFCHPNSFLIPSRHTIIQVVSDLVREWTAKGSNYVVHFTPRANYGHEPLLKEVADSLGCKVHVKSDKENVYNQISELRGVFTADSTATPLHACGGRVYGKTPRLPCDLMNNKLKVMVILPSTMFFTQSVMVDEREIVLWDRGMYRVCYSFHSSMMEVRDLVTYLQPKQVFPNVKPAEDVSLAQVQQRLNEFLKIRHSSRVKEALDSQRPLGLLKQGIKKRKRKISVTSSGSEELLFGTQSFASPPKASTVPLTPDKTDQPEETGEGDSHSSYGGSCHSDSELSGICESDEESSETLSTPRQSLLEAINSQQNSQSESLSHRVVLYDDCEQTEGKALSLEELNKQYQEGEGDNSDNDSVSSPGTTKIKHKNSEEENENNDSISHTGRSQNDSKFKVDVSSECKLISSQGESDRQSDFNGSNDLFDEKHDEMCNKSTPSEKSSDNCDANISQHSCDNISSSSICDSQSNLSLIICDSQSNSVPDDHISQSKTFSVICDNQSNSVSLITNRQSNNSSAHCGIQESQGFDPLLEKNHEGLDSVSNGEKNAKSAKMDDREPVIIITDESVSDGEDCPTEISSQESRKTTEKDDPSLLNGCHGNRTGTSNGREEDDIEALFEVDDSDSEDDAVEIIEDSKTHQENEGMCNGNGIIQCKNAGPSTSFHDDPGTSLHEESDSDATLPPSQNSYTESPRRIKVSASDDAVEIIGTNHSGHSQQSNQTPRKLKQTHIDFYVSPLKDSPEKFSPSIVKRRKKSSDWLNTSHKKLVYVSDEEECSGSGEVVDLTLGSDEES
uniref:Protein artemis n=1 Tax=Crassostrea virginica TaxID=6565 RepID=A0A8B8AXS0_CRAVI|nr:protein artemis-like isoform X2 [Crassostrea virginica]